MLSHTIGLVFLTDLLFLLRLPNYWELLNQPVSDFLEELYGSYGDNEISRSIDAQSNRSYSQNMPSNVNSDVEQTNVQMNNDVLTQEMVD